MFCLAGVGGRVSSMMRTTKSAERILAIDGCPLNCVKNCLELAGFNDFEHLQIADLGLEKTKSPVSDASIDKVVAKGRQMLTG